MPLALDSPFAACVDTATGHTPRVLVEEAIKPLSDRKHHWVDPHAMHLRQP